MDSLVFLNAVDEGEGEVSVSFNLVASFHFRMEYL